MAPFDTCPTLKNLLHHLAQKFALVSEWPMTLFPNEVAQRFQNDLAECATLVCGKLRWEIWSAGLDLIGPIWQRQCMAYANLRRLDRHQARVLKQTVFSQPELSTLTEFILLACTGYSTCQLSWPLLELVSAYQLDGSLEIQHITSDKIPATFWVEIVGSPPAATPRWFRSVRGFLISRAALFEAPVEFYQRLSEDVSQSIPTHTREVYRVLTQIGGSGTPCNGYSVIVVRSGHGPVECLSTFIGGETNAPITTLLRTWQECSEADQLQNRDIEQLGVNLGSRLLAVAHMYPWFAQEPLATSPADLLPQSGTLYGTGQGIELRPATNQVSTPWQIEKYTH